MKRSICLCYDRVRTQLRREADSAGIISRSALIGDPAFTHGSEIEAAPVSADPDEREKDHHTDHDTRTEPEHAPILSRVGSVDKLDSVTRD